MIALVRVFDVSSHQWVLEIVDVVYVHRYSLQKVSTLYLDLYQISTLANTESGHFSEIRTSPAPANF